jgi:phosphotransferase system enzyme I (PtsI)
MLLQDEDLISGVKHWITERLYNAEWALTTQLEIIARQFDEMEDEYLRERKADLEQVVERILRYMKGVARRVAPPAAPQARAAPRQQDLLLDDSIDVPLVLIAHDLSPADMLQFKQSVFAGFVTDVGGKTSHTAIVARSMDIPAVVGARSASQLVRQDDWVIIDGDAGVMIVDPSPIILAEYGFKQRQGELERGGWRACATRRPSRSTASASSCWPTSRCPKTPWARSRPARSASACSAASSCSWAAAAPARRGRAVPGLQARGRGHAGLPVTIRTIDVGADKPLDATATAGAHLNPALGLRAIRWSLADPAMFLTQLRAILRAAAHGKVNLLIPMLAHASEIRQTLSLIDFARAELDNRGVAYGAGEARRDDRDSGRGAHAAHLPEVLRLPVDRHQRPDPVHAGDRPGRRVGGAPVRPAATRRCCKLVADTIAECRARARASACAARWPATWPSRACCSGWACAASRCTRRRSWRSSRKCCAPTPASWSRGRKAPPQ